MTTAELSALDTLEAKLALILSPARPEEISEAVFGLLVMYPSGETDPRIAKARAAGYEEVLAEEPAWVLREVCRDYRANRIPRSADRQAFMPTAGEMREECARRLAIYRKHEIELARVRGAKVVALPQAAE